MIPSPEKQALGRELYRLKVEDSERLKQVLGQLTNKEAEEIYYDWEVWGRPNQFIKDYDEGWREPILLYVMGRGSGKSRLGSEWLRYKVSQKQTQVGIIGPTASDTRDVMVTGPSGILAVHPPAKRPKYEPTYSRVIWPNGSVAKAYSAEKGDRVRGGNNELLWIDEVGSIEDPDIYDQAMLTLRIGESRALLTTTPRKGNKILLDLYPRAVFNDDPSQPGKDVRIITGSTYDNLQNLSATFQQQIMQKYEGTRLGRQELDGVMLFDSEGALWDTETIESCRRPEFPPLHHFAIGIDPATSHKKGSDLTGIVGAGISAMGHGYVLDDLSGRYTTQEWANRAVSLYDQYSKYGSCVFVVERNQGGDAITNALLQVRSPLPIKTIFATADKITRATPVALLYEQKKIFHTQVFDKLEEEMCFYDGTGKSPDRLDAAVYALTELMLKKQAKARVSELNL